MREGLCLAVFLSLLLFSYGQERRKVQKIEDLGISIETVAPEETYRGEDLLIQNIETKTGGKVKRGRTPEKPISPVVEQEKTGEEKPRVKEREVLSELKREKVRSVVPYLGNQALLRLLSGANQNVRTSEAQEWLRDEEEEKKEEKEEVRVGKGVFEYVPGRQRVPGRPHSLRREEGKKEEARKEKRKGKFLYGYCIVDRDVTVGALSMKARFPCVFDDERIDSGFVWGELKPEARAYSLVFKPERIETTEGIYLVKEGTALNGSRSSVNVATAVNTRAIEKILGEAGVETAKSTKDMVREAWKNEGTTINTTGDVTIEKKEFNLNLLPYYALWTAGLSVAEGIMDLFRKEVQDIPVLFTIHRGARMYVEVYVDEEPLAR